ncbi:MAG: hypothetical protein ACO3MB_05885, partial [Saprospiraceae bacterium]
IWHSWLFNQSLAFLKGYLGVILQPWVIWLMSGNLGCWGAYAPRFGSGWRLRVAIQELRETLRAMVNKHGVLLPEFRESLLELGKVHIIGPISCPSERRGKASSSLFHALKYPIIQFSRYCFHMFFCLVCHLLIKTP